jgi:thymidylate kinase
MSATIFTSKKYPFVVVEGIDGTGKSTIARLVAAKLRGEYYKTPPTPFASVRAAIDERMDSLSRFYFYLSSVCSAASEIGIILERKPVVCDRYIYSTYAYHFVMDPKLRQCKLPLSILMPDLAILLTVNEETRKLRLRQRGTPPPECPLADERNSEFLRRVNDEFLSMPLKVIDTTQHKPDSIAGEIIGLLQGVTRAFQLNHGKDCHECAAT